MVAAKYDCGGWGCGFQPCICDPQRDQFSVYTFDPQGYSTRHASFVSAELAMTEATAWTRFANRDDMVAARSIARIIVTDGGDHTVFEWQRGAGVTFPPSVAKD